MKNAKTMTYKELEAEIIWNRVELRCADNFQKKREIICRNHDLMIEMDRRWSGRKS